MKNRPTQTLYVMLSFAFILMMGAGYLTAQVPQLLDYDGYLIENKKPANGVRTMEVRVHDAAVKGKLLYSEKIGNVSVAGGEFYFQYGSKAIATALQGTSHWLEIVVNNKPQSPRERLISVPFALKAKQSEDAQKTDADLRQVVDAVGKVVVAFGGNASNLVSNPAATIATMEKTAKVLLDVQKRFRVIAVSGNLSFGNSSTTRQFIISNTGFDRLTVSGISYPAGFSGAWSGTIEAGDSQNVPVTFTPTAVQAYSGNIVVASDASSGVGAIAVSGQGLRNAVLSGNMSFGNNTVIASVQRTLTITNTGTMNLTVSGITYPSGFSGAWSGTIGAGASQNMTVTFAPTAAQAYSGNITVNSNAVGGAVTWAVSGVGEVPSSVNLVTVTGGTLPEGSVNAGQSVASFEIGKHEVTWGEWKEVREWGVSNGYNDLAGVGDTYPSGSVDIFPVVNVSWYDVVKWSNALSEKKGLTPVYKKGDGTTYKTGEEAPTVSASANGYRLPSVKEWEWAARGGVSSQGYTYSGSNTASIVAWTYENSSEGTKAVGTKAANELGIYDMSGNVWEWCEDVVGPYSQRRRVRGGGWRGYNAYDSLDAAAYATYAASDDSAAVTYGGKDSLIGYTYSYDGLGFRLVRSSGN